jgi:hypothetical protein
MYGTRKKNEEKMYMTNDKMDSFFSDLLLDDYKDIIMEPMTDEERGIIIKREKEKKERKIQRRKYISDNNLSVTFIENIPSPKPTVKCRICGYRDLKLCQAKIHCKRKVYICTNIKCACNVCSHCICSGNFCINCSTIQANKILDDANKILEEIKEEPKN